MSVPCKNKNQKKIKEIIEKNKGEFEYRHGSLHIFIRKIFSFLKSTPHFHKTECSAC